LIDREKKVEEERQVKEEREGCMKEGRKEGRERERGGASSLT
jgi:hypothetical protein